MMPMVVSNKQTHQLEQHAERSLYAQMDKEVKGVQTDESRVNEKEKIPIINCTTSVQTESPEPTRRDSGVSACSDDEEQLQAFLQTLDPEINYDEIMEYQLALNSPLLMAPNTPLDVITEEDELNESTEMEDSMIVSYIQEGTQTEPTRRKSFSVQMTPISASLTSHQTQTAFLESSEPEECQTDLIQLLSEWVQTDAHQLINTPMQTTQLIMTQDFSQTDLIDLDCSFVQTEEENMFIPELAEHGFQTSRESTPVLEEIASLDKSLQTSLLQLAQLSNRGTQVDLLEALGDESKVLSSSGNQTSVIPTNDEECQTPIVSRKTRASQASIVHPIMSNTEVQARAVADDASIQTSILTLEQSSMQTDDKQLYDTEQQTVNAEWASTFSQTDGDVRRVHDTATTQMQTSATELCSSAAQIKPASSMKSMQTSLQKLDDFATQTGNSLRSLFFSNRSIQYSEEMLQPLLQDQGSVDISPPLTPSPPPPPPKRTKTVWTQTVTRKLPRQERIDTNFVDVEIQTNDSYLKIAKRINALRHNRADSLHIMAAPEVRKYSGQNNRPEQQGPPPEDRSRSRSSGIQGKPKPAAKVNPYNPNNETPTEPDSLHLFVPETIDTTHSPPPSPGLRGTFQKLSFKKRTPSPANNQTPASPSRGESPTASTPPPPVQINDINRKAGPSKMRSFGTIFHAKKKFERGLNGDHV